ncbi:MULTISPECIES: ROK family protein [unclassified Streptomyces]|uniref:ROK family protein n=1 Tax=Streptomyces sp. NPDC127129 TaxID=3345373 RepID=UPI003627C2E0
MGTPSRGALVGVDVGGTSVRTELFDLALAELAVDERPIAPDLVSPEQVVDLIDASVGAALDTTGTPTRTCSAPASAFPVSWRGNGASPPHWAWQDVPIKDLPGLRLDLPVHLDNPLKASTLAEVWFGAGRDTDHLAMVPLRSGVGAGFTLDGSPYRGFTNSAGEWGDTSARCTRDAPAAAETGDVSRPT